VDITDSRSSQSMQSEPAFREGRLPRVPDLRGPLNFKKVSYRVEKICVNVLHKHFYIVG